MSINEFTHQSVFITGASSGIGYAQAKYFLEKGAYVYGFDQSESGLIALKKYGGEHFAYQVGSVKNLKDIVKAVENCVSLYRKIDVLLNTAGVLDDYVTVLETDETLWDHILDTNVKGMYLVTKEVIPVMLRAKKGVIINMASIAGMIPGGGGVAYTTSKHAVVGFTKQLAFDYAKQGVRVNAIAPGAIQTAMNAKDFEGEGTMAKWVAHETPLGRWAKPEEVANLTGFIASEQASYMHGNIIPLDGGWLNKG